MLSFFLFLGIIIASEELWAWLIPSEELGTDCVCILYGSDLQSSYRPRGVYGRFQVWSSHGIVFGWSGSATNTILLVYVSNG
jgi:hypothetical protein